MDKFVPFLTLFQKHRVAKDLFACSFTVYILFASVGPGKFS